MLLAASGPAISLVAEPLFHLGSFAVTNSMLLGALTTLGLLAAFWHTKKAIRTRQYTKLSILLLWGYESLLGTTEEILGDKVLARRLAPLAITMFFVVIANNWIEIIPLVGPITWHGAPLFRGLAADLNFTLGLALITIVTAQLYAARVLGIGGNLGRYLVNPLRSPLMAFVGLLELVAEFSRLIALSMRLFGNIFGGEVLLVVIAFIASYAAPVVLPPFMLLELFVGAVQAYVFFMLTVVFVALGTSHEEEATETAPFRPYDVLLL